MPQSRASGFLTPLQTLRGLLAPAIAVGHCSGLLWLHDSLVPIWRQPDLRGVGISLFQGLIDAPVVAFFVLTGMVIGRSLDRNEPRHSWGMTYASYLMRRLLRLYPAFIVSMLVMMALAWLFLVGKPPIDFSPYPKTGIDDWFAPWLNGVVFNPMKLKSIVGNLAMLSCSFNLVTWSMLVELCGAPLMPLFHLVTRRKSPLLDLAMMAALLAVTFATYGHMSVEYVFCFYLGMLLNSYGRVWTRFLVRVLGGPGRALGLSWLAMIFATMIDPSRPPWVPIGEGVFSASVIAVLVFEETGRFRAALDAPILRWQGRLSYSFYLYHFIILTMVARTLYEHLSPEVMMGWDWAIFPAVAAGTVAAAMGVAQLSYDFIEMPFVALGKHLDGRWLPAREPPQAEAAVAVAAE